MFQNLSKQLLKVFDGLRQRGVLSEDDITQALREIRIALLEADVALPVIKSFLEKVKERALGQDVRASITPGQMVVKIVHDALVETLGAPADLNWSGVPTIVLMVGLQGAGKTTFTGKLAHFLTHKQRKRVLMVSTDVYRPAAIDQLQKLGQTIGVDVVPSSPTQKPLEIAKNALKEVKAQGHDVLLIDTAGRLHLDENLIKEVQEIQKAVGAHDVLLVADGMMGQDAVTVAQAFKDALPLTGIVLSRMDGDARGGAALSMRAVTGCPIKFLGVGEKPEQLEAFDPERLANRILDMGDIVALVEKASEMSLDDSPKIAARLSQGRITLDDFAQQLKQMQKMGGMSSMLKMLPGAGNLSEKLSSAGVDDKMLKRQLAIISSMTKKERKQPDLLNASRRRRIANGSGTRVQDVNQLLKQFRDMETMMKRMKKMGKKGLMRQGLKGLFGR